MTLRRRALAAGAAVLAIGAVFAWQKDRGDRVEEVFVAPGRSVAAAADAHPGSPLLLGAGSHAGFELDDPVALRGEPGTVVEGGIVLRGDGSSIRDLTVLGGESGISVDGARGVLLSGVEVRGSTYEGIEVVAGTATIEGCRISDMVDPLAQGIEIRNSNGLGRSSVRGCTISGGQEGIVSHVSRVLIDGNEVAGTTMRGIAVTEMSEGLVRGNVVHGGMGVGLYCGDMSHCAFDQNRVAEMRADPAALRSRAGQAAVVWFHSVARFRANDFSEGTTAGIGVFEGSVTTRSFPLTHWPPG